jgi:hypothetical protein
VRELDNQTGYMVVAEAPTQPATQRGAPGVPVWLEFGATSLRFGAKPFLRVSGTLEAPAHEARITRGARDVDCRRRAGRLMAATTETPALHVTIAANLEKLRADLGDARSMIDATLQSFTRRATRRRR